MLGLGVKISGGRSLHFPINEFSPKKEVQGRDLDGHMPGLCARTALKWQSLWEQVLTQLFLPGYLGGSSSCVLCKLPCAVWLNVRLGSCRINPFVGLCSLTEELKYLLFGSQPLVDTDMGFNTKANLASNYPIMFCLTIVYNVPLLLNACVCKRGAVKTGFLAFQTRLDKDSTATGDFKKRKEQWFLHCYGCAI